MSNVVKYLRPESPVKLEIISTEYSNSNKGKVALRTFEQYRTEVINGDRVAVIFKSDAGDKFRVSLANGKLPKTFTATMVAWHEGIKMYCTPTNWSRRGVLVTEYKRF